MAIDSAEKRKSISGVGGGASAPGVTPNSAKDQEWRQEIGGLYSGILVGGAVVFQLWTIGTADFRFLKSRIVITTADGLLVINKFKTVLDVEERSESVEGVAIGVGGTTITFATQFHSVPNLQVTVQGTTALFAVHSLETVTSFKVQVFNASGADVGGTVDWTAIGA